MRISPAITCILVLLVSPASFTAAGSLERPAPVAAFNLDRSQLPAEVYLVRTRGDLPAVPGTTVHGHHKDTFIVSGPGVSELSERGCAVYPLPAGGVPAPAPRQWNSVGEPDPLVEEMVDGVTWDPILEKVKWLVDFGTRYSFAPNHHSVSESIGKRFASIGLEPTLREFTFMNATMWNVEATHTGTVHPDSMFIICAHFDSYSSRAMRNAPGADDNATGVAAVLTAAEILSQYTFEYSIRFICFSGEEQFLQGSQRYAAWARQNNLAIAGVLNFDMIGWWTPGVQRDLEVETNVASKWLADAIINAATLYTDTPYKLHVFDGAWWGDHASFWMQGYAAVNHEESWDWDDPDFNPRYHSTEDLAVYLHPEYTVDNVKLAVAAMATLGRPVPPVAVSIGLPSSSGFSPFNPGSHGVVPVVMYGSDAVDARAVDTASLRLEGISPLSVRVRGDSGLWMKFAAGDIASAIGPVGKRDRVMLHLTGALADGRRIRGEHVVTVVGDAEQPQRAGESTPAVTRLDGAVPNPFNPLTRIHYTLARDAFVRLAVYDARGRLVERLADGVRPAGDHAVTWNAGDAASGVYFYRFESDGVVETRKLVLLK